MTDIVLEVMRVDGPPAAIERAGGKSNPTEWSIGDIVTAREAPAAWNGQVQPCSAPRKCFIMITGCPFTIERARAVLEEPYYLFDGTLQHKRAIKIPVSVLPAAARRALANPPYAWQVSWTAVRNVALERKWDQKLLGEADF